MATDSLSVALQENNQSSEQANKPIADKLAIHDLGYGVWKDLDKGPTMKVNKMAVVKKLAMGQVFRNRRLYNCLGGIRDLCYNRHEDACCNGKHPLIHN